MDSIVCISYKYPDLGMLKQVDKLIKDGCAAVLFEHEPGFYYFVLSTVGRNRWGRDIRVVLKNISEAILPSTSFVKANLPFVPPNHPVYEFFEPLLSSVGAQTWVSIDCETVTEQLLFELLSSYQESLTQIVL